MGRLLKSKVHLPCVENFNIAIPTTMLLFQVSKNHGTLNAHSLSSVHFIRVPVSRCWKMAARNTVTPCFLLGFLCNLAKAFSISRRESLDFVQ